jgi:hypothetical protein
VNLDAGLLNIIDARATSVAAECRTVSIFDDCGIARQWATVSRVRRISQLATTGEQGPIDFARRPLGRPTIADRLANVGLCDHDCVREIGILDGLAHHDELPVLPGIDRRVALVEDLCLPDGERRPTRVAQRDPSHLDRVTRVGILGKFVRDNVFRGLEAGIWPRISADPEDEISHHCGHGDQSNHDDDADCCRPEAIERAVGSR